jgi:hypothetical protein
MRKRIVGKAPAAAAADRAQEADPIPNPKKVQRKRL